MDLEAIYKESNALLEGHFLLASGKHSSRYLQSAKVLEDPKRAQMLAQALAKQITQSGIVVDTVCAPAIGGLIAGYELARALGVRSIFVEKQDGGMVLRRGFSVTPGEKVLICEDIITTGGSAQKAAHALSKLGADIVAFAALANRGFCSREGAQKEADTSCVLPKGVPFFALGDFVFPTYDPETCPLCKEGKEPAIKPGSKG